MKIYDRGDYKVYMTETSRCHCYVISYGDINILVDTGMKMNCNKLFKCLDKDEIYHLDAIFLTHSHRDHAANAQFLSEAYMCPVYIHKEGLFSLQNGDSELPAGTYKITNAVSRCGKSATFMHLGSYEPCPDAAALTPEIVKNYLGENARLIHAPFHTNDSICIILDKRIAIIGDSAFNINNKKYPAFADNEEMLFKVWGTLINSGAKAFCPSHGRPFILEELMLAYREKMKESKAKD